MNLAFMHLRLSARSTRIKRNFNRLMYVVSVVQPLALLPQIYSIYVRHDTTGLSLVTWSMLAVCNALWAVYGVVHRERLITIVNTFATVLYAVIVFGILYF